MFSNAITYPKDGTDAVKTILIGGVLTLLSFLILPLFLVIGYTVRVVRSVAAEDETAPVFDEWGELLTDGVKGFAITVVYFAVPAIVLAGFAITAALVAPARISGLLALVGALAVLPLAFAAWYVATAGFVNFAVTGRLGAAFDFDSLRPLLTSGGFATGWLVGFAVMILGSIVGSILGAIPVVGLLGAFVSFYTAVAMSYCYARGFVDAVPTEPSPEPPAADPVA